MKLGAVFHRTEVCPKTLNPVWDSQWLKFSVSWRGRGERDGKGKGKGEGRGGGCVVDLSLPHN